MPDGEALMSFSILGSPLAFLREALGSLPDEEALRACQAWWEEEGRGR